MPKLSIINIWPQPFGSGFPLQCLNPAACPPAHCQSPGLPAAFPLQSLAAILICNMLWTEH
ncbi:MAG: hypothetical protein B6D68_00545 [spirochete symbiont of Stewartia floridana]|nr:MAG: hypothetical protein B6D68_00545 [spirochete symbiont of Stewartia floridana]